MDTLSAKDGDRIVKFIQRKIGSGVLFAVTIGFEDGGIDIISNATNPNALVPFLRDAANRHEKASIESN